MYSILVFRYTSMEYTDIIGKKFGRLHVLCFDRIEKKQVAGKCVNRYYYKVMCDCGSEKIMSRNNLITGHTKSCGCNKWRSGNQSKCWGGHGDISGRHWSQILSHAKSRKLEFLITIEDAWKQFELQHRRCALTGIPLNLQCSSKRWKEKTASLDRLDNSKGYIKGNIQWVHKDINWMKGTFELSRFKELCVAVANHEAK